VHTIYSEITFILREAIEVDLDREVVPVLGRDNVGAVFTLKDLLGAILQKLIKALDLDGHKYFSLSFRSRDVKGNAVKVGHGLVDVDRCSSG
jgi:hypothetical protein